MRERELSESRLIPLVIAALVVFGACGTRVSTGEQQAVGATVPGAQETHGSGPTPAASEGTGGAAPAPKPGSGAAAAAPTAPGQTTPSGSASATLNRPGSQTGSTPVKPGSPEQTSQGNGSGNQAASSGPKTTAPTTLAPGKGPAPAAAATEPVVVASVGTLSGPVGSAVKEGVDALQIWTRFKNDNGGVGGHQIKLLVADDGGDRARSSAIVKDMVETKKVVAFVHNAGVVTGEATAQYITQKRIPVIGTDTGGYNYVYSSPMFFPQSSTGDDLSHVYLGVTAAQTDDAEKQKVGVLACAEPITACEEFYKTVAGPPAKEYGLNVVYSGRGSIAQPDYTAECLNAQRAGVKVLIPAFDTNSLVRIATSCARQGFYPRFVVGSLLGRTYFADNRSFDNAIFGLFTFPWYQAETPAQIEFAQAMKRYAPGTQVSPAHATGWVSAKLFEKALSKLGAVPTSNDILEGLWSINNDGLGGLTTPLTFTRDKPAPPRACWVAATIVGKSFKTLNGGQFACSQHYP